jgi:rare lipoprotein A (peptidoglycan hydrolase)
MDLDRALGLFAQEERMKIHPRMMLKPLPITLMLMVTAAVAIAATASYSGNGKLTWYDSAGYGACGTQLNASTQMLAAVPATYFTSANPTKDPVCAQCVCASYNGKSIKVPVKDKCPGCTANRIDLSKPSFSSLANPDVGVITTASWRFCSC